MKFSRLMEIADWAKEMKFLSRARAYAMTGDALAEDPLCSYIPSAA